MLSQRCCLPANAWGQGPDDLAHGRADEVVDICGCRLAVEHGHGQTKRLGLREDDRRQPHPAAEPVPAIRAAGRLDGDARLAKDRHVPTRRPLGDSQPLGEFVGCRAGAALQDFEGTQSTCRWAEIGRHASRLEDRQAEPELDRPELVLA